MHSAQCTVLSAQCIVNISLGKNHSAITHRPNWKLHFEELFFGFFELSFYSHCPLDTWLRSSGATYVWCLYEARSAQHETNDRLNLKLSRHHAKLCIPQMHHIKEAGTKMSWNIFRIFSKEKSNKYYTKRVSSCSQCSQCSCAEINNFQASTYFALKIEDLKTWRRYFCNEKTIISTKCTNCPQSTLNFPCLICWHTTHVKYYIMFVGCMHTMHYAHTHWLDRAQYWISFSRSFLFSFLKFGMQLKFSYAILTTHAECTECMNRTPEFQVLHLGHEMGKTE